MRVSCAHAVVTKSRVLATNQTYLKGFDCIIKGISGATLCIVSSGVSVAKTSMQASGSSILHGLTKIDPGDSPYKILYPDGGIRCPLGLFAYWPGQAGATLTVYFD